MRNNAYNNKKEGPSLFITLTSLILAFALPYLVIKYFNRDAPRESLTKRTAIELPQKTQPRAVAINKPSENNIKFVITKSGDTLANLFKQLGISAKTLQGVLQDNPHKARLTHIRPKQRFEFQFDKNNELKRLIIPLTSSQKLSISKKDGKYVSSIRSVKLQSHLHYVSATIDDSLFQTGKRLGIPSKLLTKMSQVFNWQIDFSRDIRRGDQFTLIYKAYYSEEKMIGTGDIIAASFTNKGKTYQAIRYSSNGKKYDYYDARGASLRKAFNRYPVRFSHISSPFTLSRHHPVLGIVRPHKGVDLAARLGTPIKATSDGKIVKIGRYGGYGNLIEIKHNRRYSTRYAHMVRFHKNLHKGSVIKKGQVIGYVGQTGLADGPHCHYEFHLNGVARNPVSIELPRAASIPRKQMAQFKAKAGTLLAQLKLYQEAKIAANQKSAEMVT